MQPNSRGRSLLPGWEKKSLIIFDHWSESQSQKLWGKELHFDLNSNFDIETLNSAVLLLWARKVARCALFLTLTPCCCRCRCCPVGASERLIVPAKANGVEIMFDTARLNLCPLVLGQPQPLAQFQLTYDLWKLSTLSEFFWSFKSWKNKQHSNTLLNSVDHWFWSSWLSSKATTVSPFVAVSWGYPCRLQHRPWLAGMWISGHLSCAWLVELPMSKWGSSDFFWGGHVP